MRAEVAVVAFNITTVILANVLHFGCEWVAVVGILRLFVEVRINGNRLSVGALPVLLGVIPII